MAIEKVLVPDIGEYSDVEVIEISVKKGDVVKKEDSLITLETDKATMEIPCPLAGRVNALNVKLGDKLSKGSVILMLDVVEKGAQTEEPKVQENADKAQEADIQTKAMPTKTEKMAKPQEASLDVKVPDIGEYSAVDVIEVNVKVGDSVAKEQPLITLETDKATMEIPSPEAGIIQSIGVKLGDKLSEGDAILVLGTQQAEDEAKVEKSEPEQSKPESKPEPMPLPKDTILAPEEAPSEDKAASVHAGPSVRQFARELGVDLQNLTGSGRKGRITREDLTSFIKGQMQGSDGGLGLLADPVVDFAKFGEVEITPLSRIQKISGANLLRNWVKIPHITLFDETDITELESFRKAKKAEAEKQGIKLTPVPFLVKAVASALKKYPVLNSSLTSSGDSLVIKKYIHVGVAVDTPKGLMVPVIKNADQKSIFAIAEDLMDLSGKARISKLSPDDMKGGTFTISSLGSLGATGFTPIVNMPEVAILGVSKAQVKPIYVDGSFEPRLMLPLSLSLDHRVVDGALGARFLSTLVQFLRDLREILV